MFRTVTTGVMYVTRVFYFKSRHFFCCHITELVCFKRRPNMPAALCLPTCHQSFPGIHHRLLHKVRRLCPSPLTYWRLMCLLRRIWTVLQGPSGFQTHVSVVQLNKSGNSLCFWHVLEDFEVQILNQFPEIMPTEIDGKELCVQWSAHLTTPVHRAVAWVVVR